MENQTKTGAEILDNLSELKTQPIVSERESYSALSGQEREKRWNSSGVPKRHRSYKAPTEGPWMETLSSLSMQLGKQGILSALIGPRGTGKTQMAAEAIRYQIYCNATTARYITAMEFFMAIKEGYRSEAQSQEQILLSFRQPALLVIDEITVRSDTAWENMLLTHLIDKRYGSQLDTILIGNCKDSAEVASCVGPSIASRIQECGSVIECNWKSFRVKP